MKHLWRNSKSILLISYIQCKSAVLTKKSLCIKISLKFNMYFKDHLNFNILIKLNFNVFFFYIELKTGEARNKFDN